MLVIGGFIIVGGAVMAERNGIKFTSRDGGALPFGQMEKELIYTPFACGAISAITAFIGCIGAKTRNKCGKCMFSMYLILIVISLLVGIASTTQAWMDKKNIFKYAHRQWLKMTAIQEMTFEVDWNCCNFDKLQPCCHFTPGEGECENEHVCYDMVKDHLINNFDIVIVTSFIQTVLLFITCIGSVILCQIIECRSKVKKVRKRTFEKVEGVIDRDTVNI